MNQPPLVVSPVTTRLFRHGENLLDFVVEQIDPTYVHESIIIAVTSKIVSLAEMRLVDDLYYPFFEHRLKRE